MNNDEKEVSRSDSEELLEPESPKVSSVKPQVSEPFADESERSNQIAKVRSLFIYALSNNVKELSSSFRNDPVFFSSVQLEILNVEQLAKQFKDKALQFHMDYMTGLIGEHSIVLDLQQSFYLIEMLVGENVDELGAAHMDIMADVFARLVSLMNKNLSSKLDSKITVSPCRVEVRELVSHIVIPDVEWLVCLSYVLNDSRGTGIEVSHIMPLSLIKSLVTLMNNVNDVVPSDMGRSGRQYTQSIRPIRYQELTQIFSEQILADYSINLLLDISMQLTVQLGQTRMQIRKILKLGEGSIIGLDKLAGEPVDLFINKKLVAKGEVVVIDENFGVRITEITSPRERLENLISE